MKPLDRLDVPGEDAGKRELGMASLFFHLLLASVFLLIAFLKDNENERIFSISLAFVALIIPLPFVDNDAPLTRHLIGWSMLIVTCTIAFNELGKRTRESARRSREELKAQAEANSPKNLLGQLHHHLEMSDELKAEVLKKVAPFTITDPADTAKAINYLTRYVPKRLPLDVTKGPLWRTYVDLSAEQIIKHTNAHSTSPKLVDAVLTIPIGRQIPEELRTEHHHIVAGTGFGKSECIKNMVLDDLETGASIVVIDSQGDLINALATRIPEDRLILIDPETCPPALNIFAGTMKGERDVATAIELYEYIFSALDAEMTSKQTTAYRFVSRLMLTIPGATIHTMRAVLEPGGTAPYQSEIAELGDTGRSFFQNEFDSRQFSDTRQQILRRLYTVLENETFAKMLGATDNRFDMADALDTGKVVLISTAKDLLKQTGGVAPV